MSKKERYINDESRKTIESVKSIAPLRPITADQILNFDVPVNTEIKRLLQQIFPIVGDLQ